MARLYLVRHARPASSWGGGEADPGLDLEGVRQALAARDALMAAPPGQRPTQVVSSPMRRCRETAAPLAEALGLQVEIDPAVGEIPTPAGVAPEARAAWLRGVLAGDWRDIEGEHDYAAWREGVARALLPRGRAAVLSHFVAINGAVTTILGEARVLAFQPDYASITELGSDGKALTLIAKGREAQTKVI
jgi:broad specificity phosphatase PhoE